MSDKLDRKLVNLYIFTDLLKMKTKIPKDFSKVKKIQDRRVRKLAKKAYEIPFYKERFDQAGVKPEDIRTGLDLAKLPLLTKDELRLWMKKEGENTEKYKYWFRDTTSGSTMSRKSAHSITGGRDTILQRIGLLRRGFLDQYAPEEEMIRQVNEYKPDFLYMNKTELMRLCLYCKQHSSDIYKPKFFCPTGEKIDDIARALFIEILGPGIIDSYGTAEAGACMVKLPGSNEHVVHNDSFVVNIYDDNDQLSDTGKIAVTPLYKTDLPLINYVVGDKVNSEIRDGVRFVTGVQGRMNDFFRYETGEVTTFFEIAPIIAHCEDVLQIRFIQDDYGHLTVQCVKNNEKNDKTTEQVEKELTEDLNNKFKHPFEIDYVWMNSIPPDPNGKLRMIVCNVD